MSLSDALRDKLQLPGVKAGPVEVETDEGSAQVELVEGQWLCLEPDLQLAVHAIMLRPDCQK